MQPQAELLVDARHGTGESPVWHVGEQALYWVDIPARALWRRNAASGQ
jgi:sugar lactone lactonase YvrE